MNLQLNEVINTLNSSFPNHVATFYVLGVIYVPASVQWKYQTDHRTSLPRSAPSDVRLVAGNWPHESSFTCEIGKCFNPGLGLLF